MTLGTKTLLAATALLALSIPASSEGMVDDPSGLPPLSSFQECEACPVMIVLPLGEFTMGGPPGESRLNVHWGPPIRPVTQEDPYIAESEGPLRRVEIDLPIAMGRDEVTIGEWMACVEGGGCGGYVPPMHMLAARPGSAPLRVEMTLRHPVFRVSFNDMLLYVDWLNGEVGADVYRLPTEAEWEYAARAGTQTPFWTGEEITTDQANFLGAATEVMLGEARPELVSRGYPVPVGDLDTANPWGLRHMNGNLREETMSCWTDRHEDLKTTSAHLAASLENPDCERRVSKGGVYHAAMDYGRPASRGRANPNHRSKIAGFRLVRELVENEEHSE